LVILPVARSCRLRFAVAIFVSPTSGAALRGTALSPAAPVADFAAPHPGYMLIHFNFFSIELATTQISHGSCARRIDTGGAARIEDWGVVESMAGAL
jgi:hypothetical protein